MIQRVLSALVLILAASAGAVLLFPDLFPDIALPAFLADAPLQRTMLGVVVSFVTGATLLGMAFGGLRRRGPPAYPTYVASVVDEPYPEPEGSPMAFGAPKVVGEPVDERSTLSTIMAERNWAPLPPRQEPRPPVEPELPVTAEPESIVSEGPEPEAPEPEAIVEAVPGVEPSTDALAANDIESEGAPPPEAKPEADADTDAVQDPAPAPAPAPEPDLEIAPGTTVDHQARLTELTLAADAAKATGAEEEAFGLYEEAVAEARALHAASPNSADAQAALAEAVGRVAEMNEAENRLDLALQQHEESLSLYRSLALRQVGEADTPDERRWAEGLVGAMERLADCREARGHRSRARDLYAEAVRVSQRLTWLDPNSEDYAAAYARTKARFAAIDADLQGEAT